VSSLSSLVPTGIAILLASLVIEVVALLFKVADLRRDVDGLRDEVRHLTKRLYDSENTGARIADELGLIWRPPQPGAYVRRTP
jgi:hypothetical protein